MESNKITIQAIVNQTGLIHIPFCNPRMVSYKRGARRLNLNARKMFKGAVKLLGVLLSICGLCPPSALVNCRFSKFLDALNVISRLALLVAFSETELFRTGTILEFKSNTHKVSSEIIAIFTLWKWEDFLQISFPATKNPHTFFLFHFHGLINFNTQSTHRLFMF
jgi:hypothetical protein